MRLRERERQRRTDESGGARGKFGARRSGGDRRKTAAGETAIFMRRPVALGRGRAASIGECEAQGRHAIRRRRHLPARRLRQGGREGQRIGEQQCEGGADQATG
jgi:hypothetical protein